MEIPMGNGHINVVFTMDANNADYAGAAIVSMLENAWEMTFYDIHFILDARWEYQDFLEHMRIITEYYGNCAIHCMYLNEKALNEARFDDMCTKATYFRMFLAKLLPDVEKCIYLDPDILVLGDLTSYYETDIADNYIAGVKDVAYFMNREKFKKNLKMIGFDDSYLSYVNGGSLLLHLGNMRKEQVEQRFLEALNAGAYFYCYDQDIMNSVCRDKLWLLPLKYNFPTVMTEKFNTEILKEMEIPEDELQEKLILHFLGLKPWNTGKIKQAGLWWQYAAKYEQILSKQIFERKEIPFFLDWKGLIVHLRAQKEIVIWGYSELSKAFIDYLLRDEISSVTGICDNDESKLGKEYRGIRVEDAEKFLSPDTCVVITSHLYFNTIKRQLLDMGMDESRILIYRRWSMIEIMAVDEAYQKDLISYIYEKELGIDGMGKTKEELKKYIYKDIGKYEALRKDYALDYWLK